MTQDELLKHIEQKVILKYSITEEERRAADLHYSILVKEGYRYNELADLWIYFGE